jgi:hypothetical protein
VLPVTHVRAHHAGEQPSATARSSETQKRMCIFHPTTMVLITISAIKPDAGTLGGATSLKRKEKRQKFKERRAFSYSLFTFPQRVKLTIAWNNLRNLRNPYRRRYYPSPAPQKYTKNQRLARVRHMCDLGAFVPRATSPPHWPILSLWRFPASESAPASFVTRSLRSGAIWECK